MNLPRVRRKNVPLIFGGAAVAAASFTVIIERHHFAHALAQLGPLTLLLTFGLALASDIALAVQWRCTLAGFGARPRVRSSARVFFVGQLGKYIPGSLWPMVTQMELGQRENIPRRTMAAANLTMLALSLVVGSTIAVIAIPLSHAAALGGYGWMVVFVIPLLVCLHPKIIPP